MSNATALNKKQFTTYLDTVAQHFGFPATEAVSEELLPKHALSGADDVPTLPYSYLLHGAHTNHIKPDKKPCYFSIMHPHRGSGATISFHVQNVQDSVSHALLMQVAHSLLAGCDFGGTHTLSVNTIGDTGSRQRFTRELSAYFKKYFDELAILKGKPGEHTVHEAYRRLINHDKERIAQGPLPIDHLNEKSRRTFREVLDYLDFMPEEYELDPLLIGDYTYHEGLIFSARFYEKDQTEYNAGCQVYSSSYSPYLQKVTGDNSTGFGLVLQFNSYPKSLRPEYVSYTPNVKPNIALIGIGLTPKFYTFHLMNSLLQHGFSSFYNPNLLTLSEQIQEAESCGVRYAIIAGNQEVIQKHVLLRDMQTQEQVMVPEDKFIKTIKRCCRNI